MRKVKRESIVRNAWTGIRVFLVSVILAVFLSAAVSVAKAENSLSLYASESAAHQHCPHDTVVWLNLPTRIYHLKGERWYGRTKNGAYVCRSEADAAGARASLNGQ
jgi:hypothetical protein